ncbi:MAG TPA: ATP-binding protein [Capsulimonadaceae bacterium]|jgi:two-component system phosphate regulon sensor histidine kinase PhoR
MTAAALTGDLPEFEETLKRLVDRIGKILQAERCVFLLHEPERNELRAVAPALGLTYEQIGRFRVKVESSGISGQVFRAGEAAIITDATTEPSSIEDRLAERMHVVNGVCVPLIIEKRDDNNRVIERNTIGVLHVFNKTTGRGFSQEDVHLLTRMSFSAASIITSAQIFREAVHEKQELINTIESLYLGLVVVGLNGRILQMNPSSRVILGVADHLPAVGMPYATVIENEKLTALIGEAIRDNEPHDLAGEINVPAPAGSGDDGPKERIFQVQCAPVRSDDGSEVVGVAVMLNDITEIRSVERMKTAFISTVSHELRTPLTSIKGFIETLLSDTEGFYDRDTQQEFYKIIDTECDRLTRLIEDLLNVSRIEQGRAMQLNLGPVSIQSVSDKVLSTQRAYTKPDRHQLCVDFSDDFPLVEADQDKMDQILTNLVSNAIKYSPRGGEITIIGRNRPEQGAVYIGVADHGMGIPKEHLPKVWERFHRVDNRDNREIGGTGIGLFLVKALVESHHGTVGIESEYGKGTTFWFTMPLTQPAAPEAQA